MSTTELKGRITYCNEAFVAVSGYSRDELIGQPHNIVRPPGRAANGVRGDVKASQGRPATDGSGEEPVDRGRLLVGRCVCHADYRTWRGDWLCVGPILPVTRGCPACRAALSAYQSAGLSGVSFPAAWSGCARGGRAAWLGRPLLADRPGVLLEELASAVLLVLVMGVGDDRPLAVR
ncbi:PAS domain S-box protein [Guyparkeria sp. GHLCS8-2]|uniref:PAS domain S-box protein n=1 Tax=Guyparkeria halopsychrophila TaxID=3139421 RepID=UPI0037CA5B8D